MACLLIVLLITLIACYFLIKSLKKLKKDYQYFKEQRGINEEYDAWRDLFLRALLKSILVMIIVFLLILSILERWYLYGR